MSDLTSRPDKNQIQLRITIEIDGALVSAAIANTDELYRLDPQARLSILTKAVKVLDEERRHAQIAAYLRVASKPRSRQ